MGLIWDFSHPVSYITVVFAPVYIGLWLWIQSPSSSIRSKGWGQGKDTTIGWRVANRWENQRLKSSTSLPLLLSLFCLLLYFYFLDISNLGLFQDINQISLPTISSRITAWLTVWRSWYVSYSFLTKVTDLNYLYFYQIFLIL